MTYQLDKTETRECGPTLAAKLIKLNTFEGQRPIRQNKIRHLVRCMTDGQFVKGSVAFGAVNGGPGVLVNGQHTLMAIQEAGKTVTITMDYYSCDEALDLARLFGTFDPRGAGRTVNEIIGAARPILADSEMRTYSRRFLSGMTTALHVADRVDDWQPQMYIGLDPSERINLLESKANEVKAVFGMIPEGEKSPPRVGVLLAMLLTHRANPRKASEFWPAILGNDSLTRGTPQWNVQRAITGTTEIGGSRLQFYDCATCLSWWNSWITNGKRAIVKVRAMKSMPDVESGEL